MAASASDAAEEHYVLRVGPQDLAAKLRQWLREERGLEGRAELLFEGARWRCVFWHLCCC